MDHQRRVQVVLGEAERTDGLLRFILEAEGFDLVGLASNDEELARVLRGARPSVVVLDGGISAVAALEAKERCDGAALVVVWPEGVSSVLAEERVDPHMTIESLGDAVRRAARRAEHHDEPIRLPEAVDPAPTAAHAAVAAPPSIDPRLRAPRSRRGRRRGGQLLVAATTWILVLTALTTIAAAVPGALDLLTGERTPRPSLVPPVDRPADEGRAPSQPTEPTGPTDETQPAACDAPSQRGNGADRPDEPGKGDPVRARGCPPDRGNDGGGKPKPKDGGRPDDPGNQGNGGGSGGGTQGNGGKSEDGTQGNGGKSDDGTQGNGGKSDGGTQGNGGKSDGGTQGNGGKSEEHGNAGGVGKQEEHGRAGEGGRSDETG